jgi:hypothetical protein
MRYNLVARKYSTLLLIRQSCDYYNTLIDFCAILWYITYRQKNGAHLTDPRVSAISTKGANPMALNLNPTTLAAVVEKAAFDAVDHPRSQGS